MRNEIAREFCFKEEVLPVLVVSVLINLLGPYLNIRFFGIPLVFLDMVGTAMAAILLGPWWAAAVGVLSNAFNGLALTYYFPYGIVNIMGGVVWGYWYRAYGIEAGGFVHDKKGAIRHWGYVYLNMWIAGALVAGMLSALLKLILYPPMGLPLHYNKPVYLYALAKMNQLGVHEYADIISVFAVDLYRDFLDKGIAVGIALVLAQAIGFIPRPLSARQPNRIPLLQRLKTDAESILIFVITHFAYLLLARATISEISFDGATMPILWLREPKIISLLYSPIVLGVLAFIFLSLDSNSRIGARIESAKQNRLLLYQRFRGVSGVSRNATDRLDLLQLYNARSLYGLLAMILVWPYRNDFGALGPVISAGVYFGGAVVLSGIFFHQSRNFRKRFLTAAGWLRTLHAWLGIRQGVQRSEKVLQIVAEIFEGQLIFSGDKANRKGGIFYCTCYNVCSSGLLFELRRSASYDRFVVFIPAEARTLSIEDANHIRDILTWTHIRTGVVICNAPFFTDPEALDCVRRYQGLELILLSWQEVEISVERYVRGEDVALCVPEGSLHMAEKLVRGKNEGGSWSFGEAPPVELASRALPALRHQIDRLNPKSLIADFGCGRGRHAFYALEKGHSVVAIDKNKQAVEDFKINLKKMDSLEARVQLLERDYFDVKSPELKGADLFIVTSVLQHARDEADLTARLSHIRDVAVNPGCMIFIEMLFNMKFDGSPRPGRVIISVREFEKLISEVFPAENWQIERVGGPAYQMLDFSGGGRSFFSAAQFVEQISAEYLLKQAVPEAALAGE